MLSLQVGPEQVPALGLVLELALALEVVPALVLVPVWHTLT